MDLAGENVYLVQISSDQMKEDFYVWAKELYVNVSTSNLSSLRELFQDSVILDVTQRQVCSSVNNLSYSLF